MKRERQRAKRRASAFNVFKLMLSLRTLLIMVRISDYRYPLNPITGLLT